MRADDLRHGTRRGYYAHRKAGQTACDPCKRAAAKAEQVRQLRLMRGQSGRIDATGTRRRLQALVWLGWNWKALADRLGADEIMVKRWAERDAPGLYVFPATVARVERLFNDLCMTPPPETTPAERNAASRSRNRARRLGWAPPLAYDNIDDPNEQPKHKATGTNDPAELQRTIDHAVVWRLVNEGVRVRKLSAAEAEEACRILYARGLSGRQIAQQYGLNAERYGREVAA